VLTVHYRVLRDKDISGDVPGKFKGMGGVTSGGGAARQCFRTPSWSPEKLFHGDLRGHPGTSGESCRTGHENHVEQGMRP